MAYTYRKQWRCVGQDGDVFHRDREDQAKKENHWNMPEVVFAVFRPDSSDIIADCYNAHDAKVVRDALNAAASSAVQIKVIQPQDNPMFTGNSEFKAYVERLKAKHGAKFNAGGLSAKFAPYFGRDYRLKVRVMGMVKWGHVSGTTGWQPSLMLMQRATSTGSYLLLDDKCEILERRVL